MRGWDPNSGLHKLSNILLLRSEKGVDKIDTLKQGAIYQNATLS